MAAFVPGITLRTSAIHHPLRSTFTGSEVAPHTPNVAQRVTPTARLGTVTGNSSLGKLGLDKCTERFMVNDGGRPAGFSADYEVIIQAVYRQVFGNAYIMESERADMAKLESEFRDGRTTVKEFARALGKTYEYRRRFFDGRPLYGAIELHYKHFLGRTPDGLEDYRCRSAVYDTKGYEKYIDSFFDDGEYDRFYNEWTVPFIRGHLTTSNLSMASFTHLFQVVRGSSTSDKANPRTRTDRITLNQAGIQSVPLAVIAPGSGGTTYQEPGLSAGSWQNGVSGASMARTYHGTRRQGGKMYRVQVTGRNEAKANNGGSGVSLRGRTGKYYPTRNNSAAKLSSYRRSNNVYLVPFDRLSETYVKIHNGGGKIASITPV
eukprot:Plantae.Rhodophyta-Hildenbrandia_rubra.ctg4590.p1 GENE.Plantae.Rhodophyta-Hildenbrandia_rubra.ctg4590~~Plantae.Rhodophyta-Hildenbrandia_rubra.ctg4590.p1  ORF type:complete len:376 (-),score=48.54 Plantae.Rhodophyta-Hildenbrandia_rubra.ctg4590:163-1290(-)